MVGESNQIVFLIQIDTSSFAEFEISEIEISRVDCIVMFSRFWHSTTAYGIANETSSGDLPDMGNDVYVWPADLLRPNLVLFLTVSEDVRKQRLSGRGVQATFEEKSLDKDWLFRQR